MQHIRSQHGEDVKTEGAQSSLGFMICKKSENIFNWIEWVVMEIKPFSFVEKGKILECEVGKQNF